MASATIASARLRDSSSAPLEAIRSHSSAACCGPLRAARSISPIRGSRSIAMISGSVTVPSSRSVPGAFPVRSAGPLEGEPDAPREQAEAVRQLRRGGGGAERAERASGLEQCRGLQLAAVQVALERH